MRERRAYWGIVLAATIFVAAIAGICAYCVHVACFEPPIPFSRPDSGTARGDYCAFVDPKSPWISLTLGPTLLMALIGLAFRRHRRLLIAAALLISLLMVANAIVANSLDYALPGP